VSKLNLTPQQQAVVENQGGSLLVSAAAGSGKTKVLVERLFHQILTRQQNVDDFLIITYTKAAAAELRTKIAQEISVRLGEEPGNERLRKQLFRVYRADIKTVDAFCTALLRENTHLLGQDSDHHSLTPDFRVLDEKEAVLLRQRVLDRVLDGFYGENMDEGQIQLADTLGAGRDDRAMVDLVLELYGKLQSHAYPEKWLEKSKKTWTELGDSFENTAYAQELLCTIRRKSKHWSNTLKRTAESIEKDSALFLGYGEKFLIAARGFQKLEASDGWAAALEAIAGLEFPKLNTPKGRKDDPEIASLKKIWEGCKVDAKKLESLLAIDGQEAMEDLEAVAPAMVALLDLTMEFSQVYRAEKLRMNVADFSDQEHFALKLLVQEGGHPTELGEHIAAKYTEIMVDEYQDTNEVQNAIFCAVSKLGKNIFMVGDVKQSIYRFRLADPSIFLGKYNRFKHWEEAVEGEERKILLSRNFRSRKEILDATNFIFENILSEEMGDMEYGEDEALYFGAEYYPERTDCATEFHLITAEQKSVETPNPVKKVTAEARFVAKRIRQLLDEDYPVTDHDGTFRPCRPEDIVILMRAPSSRTVEFAEALAEWNIPCSFEENRDFFHTMEISVMLAVLEVLDNPRQDVPLITVLRSPVFGFTPDRLAEIRGKTPTGDYYEAVSADGGEDCEAFLSSLREMRLAAQEKSVYQLIWHVYNQWNILGVFGAMDDGEVRRENLITFSRAAETFEKNGYKGLFAFVGQLRRQLEYGQEPVIKGAAVANGVRLMSIHKSKGLEFPIVILADLDHAFSRQDFDTAVLVHPEMGLGPNRIDLRRKIKYPTLARRAVEEKLRRENLAEEQRLLYVAMTRAKEKLILVDSMYFAAGRLQKLGAMAACPVQPETVAAGKNFGEWLLLPLLCRPEAGVLRDFADIQAQELYCGETSTWQVFLHDSEEFRKGRGVTEDSEPTPIKKLEFDPELLSFKYSNLAATMTLTKVVATQLKGRIKDVETSENTVRNPQFRPLTQPKFRQKSNNLTPAERGTATHVVLEHLDFSDTDIPGQISRLRERKILTKEQAESVDISSLEKLVSSTLGKQIAQAKVIEREYRFMLFVKATEYYPSVSEEESVLLQGVVDCFFETEEGITVVDFKTDFVKDQDEAQGKKAQYQSQLQTYSYALERVLEKKVTRRILYFLSAGVAVEI